MIIERHYSSRSEDEELVIRAFLLLIEILAGLKR